MFGEAVDGCLTSALMSQVLRQCQGLHTICEPPHSAFCGKMLCSTATCHLLPCESVHSLDLSLTLSTALISAWLHNARGHHLPEKTFMTVQNCACDNTLIATSPSKGYTPNQVRVGEAPCPCSFAPWLTVLPPTLSNLPAPS